MAWQEANNKGVDGMINGTHTTNNYVENEHLQQRVAELEQDIQRYRAQVHRYEQILNRLPVMVLTKDTDSRLTYGNAAFRDLYGMNQDELQGLIDAAFNDPAYTAQYVEDDASVLQTGEVCHIEEYVTRHDGAVRAVHTIKAPLYDEAGQIDALVAVVTDITERKEAQEALQHTNTALAQRMTDQTRTLRVFKTLIDNAPDAIVITDVNGVVTYINPAFKTLYGYGDEAVGMTVADFFPAAEHENLAHLFQYVNEHGLWQGVLTHQRKDGSIFIGEESALVILNEHGEEQAMGAIVRDITERRQQEEALRSSEIRQRALLDAIPDMMLRISEEHIFLDYRQAQGIEAYVPPEVFLGKYVQDVLPPDVADLIMQAGSHVLSRGERQLIEYQLTMSDGVHSYDAWVVASADNTYLVLIRESTERKRAEKELRLFKALIENAPDGFAMSDLNGNLTYANPAYSQALGEESSLLGQPLLDHLAEDQAHIASLMEQVMNEGSWQGELCYQRSDGSTFPGQASSFVVYDADGQPQVIAGIVRDITEQKRIEEDMQRLVAIVENSLDFVGTASFEGEPVYISPAGLKMVGLENMEHARQYNVIDFYPAADRPVFEQEIMPTVLRDGFWQGEFRFRHLQTDAPIPVHYTLFVVKDPATGTPLGMGTVTRDITEQKRQEVERTTLQQQLIDAQRDALRELSTPLIPITDDVVIMPLIGTVDSGRAQQIMETLLEGVARQQAKLAILDITGVSLIDTQVAQALIQAAQAVRLLGAQVMLTGIQPQIAQTLIHMGVDLSSILTRGSLQSGIASALTQHQAETYASRQ
jgi:rsbT co-antagonist protein RsbR